MSRIVLNHTRDLSAPGFYLLADNRTVRACVAEADSGRHTVEFGVYWKHRRSDAFFIHPIDSELCTWVMESAVVHRDLARIELQFSNVPAGVASHLKEL